MTVVVATPCYGGQLTAAYFESVVRLIPLAAAAGIPLRFDTASDSLITRARNDIVARFLDDEAATHLFFVDADIGFAPDQFFRLLAANRPVTAAAYPLKRYAWDAGRPADPAKLLGYCMNVLPGAAEEEGFAEALDAGTGFMCIRRDVLEVMAATNPDLSYTPDMPGTEGQRNNFLFFDTMVEERDGARRYLSEDYAFCRRAQRAGFKVWVDLRSTLDHVGPETFRGSFHATFG